jgi:hypothetical protein
VRSGSFLSWLGVGLLVATAPFVAQAQLDDAGGIPGGDPSDAAGAVIDTGSQATDSGLVATNDSMTSSDGSPGPTLPNGEPVPGRDLVDDTPQGCTCSLLATTSMKAALPVPVILVAAWALRRRMRR